MHEFYELKEMLMEEVNRIAKKGELNTASLETIDKLLNSIKNACKIIMYDEYDYGEYSREGDMPHRDGYSYARGRNAKRDRMGRYSREGGYSYVDGEKKEKIEMLRGMMNEAGSDEERRTINSIIRRMEKE